MAGGASLVLRDLAGRIVFEQTALTPGIHTMDVAAVGKGVYLVQLANQQTTYVSRLVIR